MNGLKILAHNLYYAALSPHHLRISGWMGRKDFFLGSMSIFIVTFITSLAYLMPSVGKILYQVVSEHGAAALSQINSLGLIAMALIASPPWALLLAGIFLLYISLISISQQIHRLHDIGLSAWTLVLVYILPIPIAVVVILVAGQQAAAYVSNTISILFWAFLLLTPTRTFNRYYPQ